jgi:hypothetical protein
MAPSKWEKEIIKKIKKAKTADEVHEIQKEGGLSPEVWKAARKRTDELNNHRLVRYSTRIQRKIGGSRRKRGTRRGTRRQ